MLKSVIHFQIDRIKNNVVPFILLVFTALAVLYIGYAHHTIKQAVAYLLVMWLCSYFTDYFALLRPAKSEFIVRQPQKESLYFIACFCLGVLFLFIRFSGVVDWQQLKPMLRLATLPLLLFMFPIALAIILLLLKYKPNDLGIRLQGFLVILPVIILSVFTNRLVAPQSLTWNNVLAESGGILGALFTGLIVAGLSEEFFRTIGQSRIGAWINNKGIAWFLVTFFWALMHAPKWYSESHSLNEALLSAVRIVPIGLMWGYITHRTKSILPAVIIHGLNYWGLQNF